MNKKLVAPFITWLLFVAVGLSALINGIQQHEAWRVIAAGLGLLISTWFIYMMMRDNDKELKPVRVKSKNR